MEVLVQAVLDALASILPKLSIGQSLPILTLNYGPTGLLRVEVDNAGQPMPCDWTRTFEAGNPQVGETALVLFIEGQPTIVDVIKSGAR